MGKDGKSGGACPLKHTDVDAQISGFIARVNVTQEFHNPTDEKIEADLHVPAARGLRGGSHGDEGRGADHRRRDPPPRGSQAIYQAAKEAGHVASLLDQERPNIFTQSVANIMPGEKVTITISYTQMLKYEAGRYEFVFPMVVGPRYHTRRHGDRQDRHRDGAGHRPGPGRLQDHPARDPQGHPRGARHLGQGRHQRRHSDLLGQERDCTRSTTTSPSETIGQSSRSRTRPTIPNKDFVLHIRRGGREVQSGVITTRPSGNGGFFTLIMQPPKIAQAQRSITPKEMIFVIDTSGSQQGEPIGKSKETMFHCIKNMNPGDTFNMIAFSNQP